MRWADVAKSWGPGAVAVGRAAKRVAFTRGPQTARPQTARPQTARP
jgi:hypothetical protein